MKKGDLVKVRRQDGGTKICVALHVDRRAIQRGINVNRPGLYLFRGYWYGDDPFDFNCYGKIEGETGRVCGRLRSHRQARLLEI
jgi:hypothetical protein